MNRLVIPSVLAVTVLVAGIFAFTPVERATTVHTIIQANTSELVSRSETIDLNDDLNDDFFEFLCDKPYQLLAVHFTNAASTGSGEFGAAGIRVNDVALTGVATIADNGITVEEILHQMLDGTPGFVPPTVANSSTAIDIDDTDDSTEDADVIDITAVFLTNGDATCDIRIDEN